MMSDEMLLCPVCGYQMDEAEDSCEACPTCGFPYPSIRLFSSRESRGAWRKLVTEYSDSRLQRFRSRFARGKHFATMRSEAYFLANDNVLYACSGKGMLPIADDIRNFSVSGRSLAVITTDGVLRLRSLGAWSTLADDDFIDVETSSDCTYAIRKDGTVFVYGICSFREEVNQWHDVAELSSGLYHLAARLVDGAVIFSGSVFAQDVFKRRNSWRDIIGLVSSSDCTFGLTKDGRVEYAGPDDSRRNVNEWTDILSVASDENYVVGLTKTGEIVLEARMQSNAKKDARLEAESWKDVLAISCGRSCIAAIDKSGHLRMTPMSPLRERMISMWKTSIALG